MSAFFVLKDLQRVQNCISYLNEMAPSGQTVKIDKPKRSLPQNNYWHMLIDIIAKHTGDDPEDLKDRIKFTVLPKRELTVGSDTYLLPGRSSTLSKEDFSRLVDATVMLGTELGLTLPTPGFYGLE